MGQQNDATGERGPALRVSIIDPLGAHGGHHYYVHNQANGLVAEGASVTVFNSSQSRLEGARYRHFVAFQNAYSIKPKALGAAILAFDVVRSVVTARILGTDFCLFHIFRNDLLEYVPVRLSRLLGMRVTCVVHDIERIDRAGASGHAAAIAKNTDVTVVHNQFSRRLLEQDRGDGGTVHVVPHGNYISQYPVRPSRAEARARLEIGDGFHILFFGNPRKTKGLDLLLEAAARTGRRDFRLIVAGKMKPPELEACRARIAELGIAELVRIDAEHIADADLPYYFCGADLIAQPYLKIYESGVTLMAMSLARPVLVSDLEPLVEVTGGGERGMLFRAADPDDLAAKLGDAIDGRVDLEAMAGRGFAFAERERSWEACAAQLRTILLEALGRRASG